MKQSLLTLIGFNKKDLRHRNLLAFLTAVIIIFSLTLPVNADQTALLSTTPTPNAGNQPLKLTFPSAAAHPVSGWRPPLFPVPFALGPHDHFYLYRPISVTSVNWPLPDYRYGYQESEMGSSPHTGVDIDAPLHTSILAAGDGKIVFTGYGLALGGGNTADPYGLAVVIRHNFSFNGQSILTVYAHMEKITVKMGQWVKAGDQLGLVGITGNTSGPHVHFEIRLENGNTFSVQNPELWMVPPTDCGVLVGQFKDSNGILLVNHKVWIKSESGDKTWTVVTYANQSVKSDPYYQENFVLGDLQAGKYKVTILTNYKYYDYDATISPGEITYFTFTGGKGFQPGSISPADPSTFLLPVK